MGKEESIERRIRRVLVPVSPRKGYAAVLKNKLLNSSRMPVELEQNPRVNEIITLTAIGVGALATVAAAATIGAKFVGLLGSGAILLKAASKTPSAHRDMKSQAI
jgi:hypothetical protein